MASNSSLEERKKRTLDALERRLAQEKAAHLLQQQKSKRRLHGEHAKDSYQIKNSSAVAPAAPSTNSSYKKGNITFSGYMNKEEASDPAYFQLAHDAHENLLKNESGISKDLSVDHLLHDLFQHGNSAEKYMQGSRGIRIDNWILLDNFIPPSNSMSASARSQSLKTHPRRSKSHMSLKQHKKSGSFNLPKELQNFELFKPMHEMWKSYTTQLLKHVGKNQLAQCLLNADLHGSLMLVVQCKVCTLCGVHGIMVRETAETFGIITEDNKFRVVPKKLSVFVLQVDCWKITLLGDKLASRSQVQ
ncbi:OLC1v1034640C4 [Oldenlandia corymbosa var. corymbosa]|uniref:OLC1v1034640C4 n=1 Tax=Oldenlandia corymbosa var. corymbosa TaxID=529605 RepID=A0AAV1CRR6_OLDCO|nr:OLC1v1034640C4 [Oldenlandia corymbosa var. corymbosa]